MLSRIADSLFWLNRYMERARCILLTARTHYIYSLDKHIDGGSWTPILEVFTNLPKSKLEALANDTPGALRCLLIDQTNRNAIKVIISLARENARGVQEQITREVWEEINSFYHLINQPQLDKNLASQDALNVIDLLLRHSMFYTGVADVTMQRGTGWNVMKLGKYIERCLNTLLLTDKQSELFEYDLSKEKDISRWRFLLLSLSGYEAFLKTYRANKYNQNVMHQTIYNQDFPHSVLYCMDQIDRCLQILIRNNQNPEAPELMRTFGQVYSRIKYSDPAELVKLDLEVFFKKSKQDLRLLNEKLEFIFFSY